MRISKYLITIVILTILPSFICAQKQSGIRFVVSGKGRPVILVPGLASSGSVWDETMKSMGKGFEFHVLTLPGFAGNPSLNKSENSYLSRVRTEILHYIKRRNLGSPIIIGHSLGGFLALDIAINSPDIPCKLVILDALPFAPALRNPSINREQAKTAAIAYKKGMEAKENLPLDQKTQAQKQLLSWMITDPKKIDIATKWYLQSDSKTVASAMYELNTTDLRSSLDKITVPTLVLGSWFAGKPYGATKSGALKSYKAQYQKLQGVKIFMSDKGKHFIMWDDPEFLIASLKSFL